MRFAAIFSLLLLIIVTSCNPPMRFTVSQLGYEPEEIQASTIYFLPKTGLKAEIQIERTLFIPGPYSIYAQRMLGIEGVEKERYETYSIQQVILTSFIEADENQSYVLNTLEGNLSQEVFEWLENKKLLIRGTVFVNESLSLIENAEGPGLVLYDDVTMESNIEMRQQTIYKTIITDTSFVRVPVTTQQMERKTLEKKAEEAAKLILEIRSDRYYLAAGIIDPFPDNLDLKTAIAALDRLEAEYLSLFIGKTFKEQTTKEYFATPSGYLEDEVISLDRFSVQNGIGDEEGAEIRLIVKTPENISSLRNLLPQVPEENTENRIYYRLPAVCDIVIEHEARLLHQQKLSIYQAGALVNEKVPE